MVAIFAHEYPTRSCRHQFRYVSLKLQSQSSHEADGYRLGILFPFVLELKIARFRLISSKNGRDRMISLDIQPVSISSFWKAG